MANGKVFTDETKDLLVDVIEKAAKFGPVIELVDGPLIRGAINLIDHYGDKVIPDEYDELLNEAATLALDGEYEEAAGKCGEIIDMIIDLKFLPDEYEKLAFVDGLKFIVRQIQIYIEKKKEQ